MKSFSLFLNRLQPALALLMVFPLYWMVLSALNPTGEIESAEPRPWTLAPTLDSIRRVFGQQEFGRYFANSLVVACTVVVASALIAAVLVKSRDRTYRRIVEQETVDTDLDGIPDVYQEGKEEGLWIAGAALASFGMVGAVLTLGLVQRWGEVFPRWMVGLGGRPVPPMMAVVPAVFVSVLVTAASFMFLRVVLIDGVTAETWAFTLPEVFWVVWGAALFVAALAYHRRRRPACASCDARLHGPQSGFEQNSMRGQSDGDGSFPSEFREVKAEVPGRRGTDRHARPMDRRRSSPPVRRLRGQAPRDQQF